MIVGTAGHIDHGKTTLVRALTGVDTDRLKEEKARGISIELGYAYAPLAGGGVLGFIDVPGHERLIHTMVAGACGIDFALLVVAADDGPMPQTHEHLAILALLGIERGAVALSKSDRVGSARLAAVEEEIAQLLSSTALAGAPIFPLDARRGDDPGVAALRAHLEQRAARAERPDDARLFRLSADRVFSLPGHGTVVTGTVFSGEIRTGDTVAVMPAGRSARVRRLHVQNRPAECGRRGERCALNLAGIERSAVVRGDWLAEPALLVSTRRMDARLQLLPHRQLQLRAWTPLHLHLGTMHTVMHVVPLEGPYAPADSRDQALHVQLVFDRDVCALPGDRFILRDAQALHTVGGGVVIDPYAPARRRRTPERCGYRAALARLIEGEGVGPLLEHSRFGTRISDLVRLTGLPAASIRLPPGVVTVQAGPEQHVLSGAQWSALRAHALEALADFHARLPQEPGPDLARLRRIAAPGVDAALWRALIEKLVDEGAIVRSPPWLRLPGHNAAMSAQDLALAQSLQPLLAAGGFDPPWVRTLASSVHEPEERVREVLRRLLTNGSVLQVMPDLFYDAGRVAELAELAGKLAREHGAVSAARYRDAVGTGRKRAIQILEFFDRVGYTRRVRDTHVLRREDWRTS